MDGESLEAVVHRWKPGRCRRRHRRDPARRGRRVAGGGRRRSDPRRAGLPRRRRDEVRRAANERRGRNYGGSAASSRVAPMIAPSSTTTTSSCPAAGFPRSSPWCTGRRRSSASGIPFGHAGDGNIHVNIMSDPRDGRNPARSRSGALTVRRRRLDGGLDQRRARVGFAKSRFLEIELSQDEIALMKRIKQAFDPLGILNPGRSSESLSSALSRSRRRRWPASAEFELECPDAQACRRNPPRAAFDVRATDPAG